MTDDVTERLTHLEENVRRAGEAIVRLRDENARLKREVARLSEDQKQWLSQVDGILKDIAKLELD
jgi:chromosome segregation ATPase